MFIYLNVLLLYGKMPYNAAQVVFTYNNATIPSPPMTMPDIVAWVKAHPNRFTYAQPMNADGTNDFTGAVFIRQVFYEYAGPYTDFFGDFNEQKYLQRVYKVFQVLRDIEPYLLQQGGKAYYPANQTLVEQLYADGRIDLVRPRIYYPLRICSQYDGFVYCTRTF